MPDYIYTDEKKHEVQITHRMLYSTGIICAECGAKMWRKPVPFRVSWNGLKPSGGQPASDVQTLIDTADQRRDDYWRKKEMMA